MPSNSLYFIDHYDSFSFNVVDWLRGTTDDLQVEHIQYDDAEKMASVLAYPKPLVISPGPRHPLEAKQTTALVRALLGKVPILGICLGHQILGAIGGYTVTHACSPFHGSASDVDVVGPGLLFAGISETFKAATYNSLVVKGTPKEPDRWRVNAINTYGEIQALTWSDLKKWPAFGVQFHPESFLTENQGVLRANWMRVVEAFTGAEEFTKRPSTLSQTSATAPLSMPS